MRYAQIMKNAKKQVVSVIIPVLNELENVKKLHKLLLNSLKKADVQFELIYVDDRSSDGTYEYLKRQIHDGHTIVHRKEGKQGKSYSLFEGFSRAKGNVFAMIDADLQYPPTAISHMVNKLEHCDIVVANRKVYRTSLLRKFLSRGFRAVFGSLMFGLHTDVQSGLKVFTREAFEAVKFDPKSNWTFDLEFLYKAREAGYTICNYDIIFAPRENGNSKVQFINQSVEIGSNALQVKLKRLQPTHIPAKKAKTMLGAGIGYKRRQYITHTTLPHHKTALQTFVPQQVVFMLALLALTVAGFVYDWLLAAKTVVAVLSVVYFVDVVFNLLVIMRSLQNRQELSADEAQIEELKADQLPVYSILCPLYKESAVVPQFLKAIEQLDWPKNKLDVLLLLEEDDTATIEAVKQMNLPRYVRIVVVPDSKPKTKPKACNYGLSFAKGEYVVIFDAEDIPDPLQLKKAYLGFQNSAENVICLQAKLNYYNPHQNWLTRFFTAEYSLWFDLTLTGYQSINTSIPLGGTSNHFKTKLLRDLQGWDTFNVTEDADLGIRLFKAGYTTAIIDSVTLEEANSNPRNWIRQRSRWIKGYMQSYLVHTRDFPSFLRTKGIHAFLFQLVVGSKLIFIFLNPLLWLTTIAYFAAFSIVGPTIELIYLTPAFYVAVISLVFGNFLFLYYYMIGCIKRQQWELVKYVFGIPIYWIMISVGGWVAFYQLLFKPHYWEKTIHGLHLGSAVSSKEATVVVEEPVKTQPVAQPAYTQSSGWQTRKNIFSGALLIGCTIFAHFINLAFSIVMFRGETLDLQTVSVLSLINSLSYISMILINALNSLVSHRTGFLDGRFGSSAAYTFWKYIRGRTLLLNGIIAAIWLMFVPFTASFFNLTSVLPLVLFTPVWLVSFGYAVDRGYLSGKLNFAVLGMLAIVEPLSKFLVAGLLLLNSSKELTYTAIPASVVIAFITAWVAIKILSKGEKIVEETGDITHFPKKFYAASMMSGISAIAFLSLDILLANRFLPAEEAGVYAVLSLAGKMIYFLGQLSSQFAMPVVSRLEGEQKDTNKAFVLLFLFTTLMAGAGFIALTVFKEITLPLLLAERALLIMPYITLFAVAMLCFTLSRVIVVYYLARKVYSFPVVVFLLTTVQIVLIDVRHESLHIFVSGMAIMGVVNLLVMSLMHINVKFIQSVESALTSLSEMIKGRKFSKGMVSSPSILIFNWRDTKHAWAGGAEVYVHEIAKRWVKQGNKVTVFCGNDGHLPQNQTLNGVEVVRRGGTYTVYLWAFLYYIFAFRGKYDVIIDCENGVPFFTPLYVRKPVFLLVHHVHQEVFREHLSFPFSWIAAVLESKLMPFLYKNRPVITVSESSKKEIVKLGFSNPDSIEIIYNGINTTTTNSTEKTVHPTFVYLGRLKAYKNVDIAIRAFAKVVEKYPSASFDIVGDGESMDGLKALTNSLNLSHVVRFHGRVSEKAKTTLLARSWAMIQPSMMEGWGLTVIEANVNGTAVIASRVNGLKDSVVDHETGMLVKPGSVKDFTAAMVSFIEDQAMMKRLSAQAIVWSRNFTWERSARAFYAAIENVVRGNVYLPKYTKLVFAKSERI